MDAAYLGKKFDIVGQVHLPQGSYFVNRFGRRARHGYVIQDRATGEKQVVGWQLLKKIHDLYLAVDLPTRRTYRRDAGQATGYRK
jgi:hypothetical protein